MKNNIKWIAFFALVCIVCGVIWSLSQNSLHDNPIAQIRQDGKIIRTVDLSAVKEPYELTVSEKHGGYNKIRVEKGKIAVVEADCPDKICVNQGYIENSTVPIVCLPHKLSITVTGKENSIDAVAGGE